MHCFCIKLSLLLRYRPTLPTPTLQNYQETNWRSASFVISASGRICLLAACVKVSSSESVLNITLFAICYFSPIKNVVRHVKFCLFVFFFTTLKARSLNYIKTILTMITKLRESRNISSLVSCMVTTTWCPNSLHFGMAILGFWFFRNVTNPQKWIKTN